MTRSAHPGRNRRRSRSRIPRRPPGTRAGSPGPGDHCIVQSPVRLRGPHRVRQMGQRRIAPGQPFGGDIKDSEREIIRTSPGAGSRPPRRPARHLGVPVDGGTPVRRAASLSWYSTAISSARTRQPAGSHGPYPRGGRRPGLPSRPSAGTPTTADRQELVQIHGGIGQAGPIQVEQADPIFRSEDVVALEVAVAGGPPRPVPRTGRPPQRERGIAFPDGGQGEVRAARLAPKVEVSSDRRRGAQLH